MDSAASPNVQSWIRPFRRIEPPPQPGAIPLYSDLHPGELEEAWYQVSSVCLVRNISVPTLTPFLPDPTKATGAAVVVAPGGGFMTVNVDHEGWRVAKTLADRGIAAFVLKYRVNETPADEDAFLSFFQRRLTVRTGSVAQEPRATQDALVAIEMVRANADAWGIQPDHVGILGFSAGAMVAIKAAIDPHAAGRPSFIAPIYPSLGHEEVPNDAPPMFLAFAFDDEIFGGQDLAIVEAWRRAGRPIEFHGYERGGHGFVLGKPSTTSSLVFEQLILWMQVRGLLTVRTDH